VTEGFAPSETFGNKQKRNMEKPIEIIELEKELGFELKQAVSEEEFRIALKSYLLNQEGQIIGLNNPIKLGQKILPIFFSRQKVAPSDLISHNCPVLIFQFGSEA
ncbi:MAG: hypothetical protein RJA90_1604, partial [Bacteroidota bacterium]